MESGDVAEAQKSTRTAVSLLDRAGSRGYIHRNKASRLASRLTKGLNRMISEPSQDAKPRSGSARRGASKKEVVEPPQLVSPRLYFNGLAGLLV